MPGALAFLDATAVQPTGGGRWSAHIPDGWNVPTGIHGGMLLATALRAAGIALDETGGAAGKVLRTAHGSFLAQPTSPQLSLTAEVLRSGGTTAHVDIAARSAGQPTDALVARALFARRRPGDHHLDVHPPDLPAAGDLEPMDAFAGPLGVPPLFAQFDARTAVGTLPWDSRWRPGQTRRYARWNRYHRAPRLADGTYDPLALLPFADLPGPSLWLAYGPDEPIRLLSSLELTLHVLEPVVDEWVLTDFRARWTGDGYLLSEGDVWSGGRLVATSTQLMMVRLAAG